MKNAPSPAHEAANAERAARAAPEFLSAQGKLDWKEFPEAARVYIWRRVDELRAAPAKREAKLVRDLGFADGENLHRFQNELEPFTRHAARRNMTLSAYLAFFTKNEAKARGGNIAGAVQSLLSFAGLDPEKLGRSMLATSAALHLPRFNGALEASLAAFSGSSLDREGARQAIAGLAAAAARLNLSLDRDASRFERGAETQP